MSNEPEKGEASAKPIAKPHAVYHYTDASGLLGILGSGAIWCTNIRYLNDSLEYQYGLDVFHDVVGELLKTGSEDEKHWAEAALLDRNQPPDNSKYLVPLYVASFSASRDDLGQWRGYANSGPRFSIGFDREALEQLAQEVQGELSVVNYDRKAISAYMRAEFKSRTEELDRYYFAKGYTAGPRTHVAPHQIAEMTKDIVNTVAPTFKHEKFSQECEWRLVVNLRKCDSARTPETKFRAGRSFLVPYIEIPFLKRPPIDSITIGPTPHPDAARVAIKHLIASETYRRHVHGTARAPVEVSSIPYRDW